MLCWFLTYNSVNQLEGYVYPVHLETTPPPIFLGCHTVTGWELPLGIYFILGNVLIHGKLSRWLSAGDGFSPWVWKIPWRRKWQSAPIFLPENLMDRGAWQPSPWGCKSQTWLSTYAGMYMIMPSLGLGSLQRLFQY